MAKNAVIQMNRVGQTGWDKWVRIWKWIGCGNGQEEWMGREEENRRLAAKERMTVTFACFTSDHNTVWLNRYGACMAILCLRMTERYKWSPQTTDIQVADL